MKNVIHLITVASLPFCGTLNLLGQGGFDGGGGQVSPAAPAQPAPPPGVKAPPKPMVAPTGAAGFRDRLQRIITRGSGPAPQTLVIRSSPLKAEDQAKLEEDLAVMAHILKKAVDDLPGEHPQTAMGINVIAWQIPAGMQGMYLEGYGSLFTLNVGFPLLPPPAGPAPDKEEPPVDSTWEEARQELYGQVEGPGLPGSAPEEFSADKVTRLADALVEALKNGANIRHLKPDDSLTVCVLGTAPAPGRPVQTTGVASQNWVGLVTSPGASKGTTMTIRVKKSDADALAKGELKLDEFRKQARIEKYEGPAAASGGAMGFGGGGYGTVGGYGGGGGGAYGRVTH